MPRVLVANELSFVPAPDRYVARERMARFLGTLVAAFAAGAERRLRAAVLLDGFELAPGYRLPQWRNDSDVDRESRTRMKSLQVNSPPIRTEDGEVVAERQARSEYRFQGKLAEGLGAAALLRGLGVSLAAAPEWEATDVGLEECFLGDEDLEVAPIDVPHASAPSHVHAHREWLQLDELPVDGPGDLWRRREVLFPHLTFCAQVEKQLGCIDRGAPMFDQVLDRLRRLQRYFAGWDGTFRPELIGVKATPESATTLEQFGAERTILCPDGLMRLFEWHVRMTPGAWRLYFHPHPESLRAFIGYIGPKPAATRYRT